jgi:hypothetical protein
VIRQIDLAASLSSSGVQRAGHVGAAGVLATVGLADTEGSGADYGTRRRRGDACASTSWLRRIRHDE